MLVDIDVKKLSKEEQYQIVKEILSVNSELRESLNSIVANENKELDNANIDKLILEDFARYDEVFRKLA